MDLQVTYSVATFYVAPVILLY